MFIIVAALLALGLATPAEAQRRARDAVRSGQAQPLGRATVKVGDEVQMYGFLGRDGRKMLSIMTVTLADGTVLTDRVPENPQ